MCCSDLGSSTRLVVQNSELGYFNYELLLRALPAPPEKPLLFRVALGAAHYLSARFTNYSRVKAEYSWKVGSCRGVWIQDVLCEC